MDYFFHKKDPDGYIHSIDNLILTYYMENIGTKAVQRFLESVQALKEEFSMFQLNYWEKLDLNPCRKYSFYQHAIHLDDGIYLLIGHYKDFDKEKGEMYTFPMIRLELNPNKHADKPILKALMDLINQSCYNGYLDRYDYAIDIPLPPKEVQVFDSRKEKGLYKGTRYYGQRNKNGFCRIYDKAKEQGLETPLTRVEHVISCTKTTKNLSLEKVYVRDVSGRQEKENLSKTDEVILELCLLASTNGLDYEPIIEKLEKRKRKFIKSQIDGYGYKRIGVEKELHDALVTEVMDYFGIKDMPEQKEKDDIKVNEDGFIDMEQDYDLPFD